MMDQQVAASSTAAVMERLPVTIRRLEESDRAALLAFGAALPKEDLMYLEEDLQSADIVTRLVNAAAAENWRQVIAVSGDEIVGYSAVRRLPGWSSHVADILLVVSKDWRRANIGTMLAQAIFDAARELGAAKVIVEMMEEQTAGKAIFERLGFHVEGRLSAHARDRFGRYRNLLILAFHVP